MVSAFFSSKADAPTCAMVATTKPNVRPICTKDGLVLPMATTEPHPTRTNIKVPMNSPTKLRQILLLSVMSEIPITVSTPAGRKQYSLKNTETLF